MAVVNGEPGFSQLDKLEIRKKLTIQGVPVSPGGGTPTTVLAASSNATQAPSSLNTPLRVEFGAAQGTGSDPVQIDATGLITVNTAGRYNFRAIFSVERSTGTGEAFIFFRVVVNGNQSGNAIVFQLDAQEITLPPQFNFDDDFSQGDTIEVQFYRDGQGTPAANDGSLVSYTSQIGWGATPSASLTITRFSG